MAIGTVLEDHFLFIICQVKLLMSSVRREAAYHDLWGRGVCCEEGGVTVSSNCQECELCDVTVMRARHMSRVTSQGIFSLLVPLESDVCCHPPPPLPLFGIWDELKEKESTLSAVKWEIFERWEKNIFDDDKIFALMRRGRCWYALAHL